MRNNVRSVCPQECWGCMGRTSTSCGFVVRLVCSLAWPATCIVDKQVSAAKHFPSLQEDVSDNASQVLR